ncbi:thermonuclease family protein [Nocardioides sp. NPDC092400]|uniref:thermonuclease family protein n=1 Tax=Nocardioides sp. NPDC092400 TaxID=3155196 RepID=UPI00343F9495
MTRKLPHLVIALFLAIAALVTIPATATAVADKDCGDFATQAAAQKFFINNGGSKNNDPHALDADGDGVACESNPCPCSTNQGGGGGGDNGGTQPEPQPVTKRQKAKIIRVIDGDTVQVKLTAVQKRARVRLIGIDTPEVFGGKECGGPAASKSAKKILPKGTRVLLVSDPTQDLKDRYGRLLRYVMKGSTDVNRLQVKRGHAEVYVYGGKPFKRVKKYRASQAAAKKADLGMWGACK